MGKSTLEIKNSIGYICLDSPENLNALDIAMDASLIEQLDRCENNEKVSLVIIYGTGRAFSAGGDMDYFKNCLETKKYEDLDKLLVYVNTLILKIKEMKKLVLISVHGHAAGGGANLALIGDYVVADETAVFTQSFTKIGLAPDAGGMYILSKLVGPRKALDICMSARPIKASEALALGLVDLVVPQGSGLAAVESKAQELLAGKLKAAQLSKEQNTHINYADFKDYLFGCEKETVGEAFRSPEFANAVEKFLAKRKKH